MNLLLINYEYPPIGGGAANATWHLAKAFTELGHQVTVLTAAYKDLKGWRDENGVDVYRCRAIRKNRATSTIFEMASYVISAALKLPKIVRDRNIDGIIVFFLFPCGPLGLIPYYLYRTPFAVSLRGGDVPGNEPGLAWIHRLLTLIRRLIYRKSISVIANSNGLKKLAQKKDPVDIFVIPNGVDTDFFRPKIKKKDKQNSTFQFLYVGRFQPEKNLCFMFECLAKCAKKIDRAFVLHMVGEGPQKKELFNLAENSGLNDQIKWHGWLDRNQLPKMYQNADCLIMPSRYEGMSNVILEAMACGLPVIASRVDGNIDLVDNGNTGYLLPREGSDAYKSALQSVMENQELAFQMGVKANKKVLSDYNWKAIAEKYAKFF